MTNSPEGIFATHQVAAEQQEQGGTGVSHGDKEKTKGDEGKTVMDKLKTIAKEVL